MSDPTQPRPSFAELTAVFGRIGLINFGGPAGQIALMHRVLVEDKAWIGEDAYLRALNFCALLPGPEAQQLAAYVGWKLHGVRGGLAAGLLFVAPGSVVVLALAALYAVAADLGPVQAAFLGVKAAVLAIVIEALIRLGRKALNGPLKLALAAGAFLGLFVFHLPFPVVVLAAGLIGLAVARWRPDLLRLKPVAAGAAPRESKRALAARTAVTILVWSALWAAPIVLAALLLGPDHVLTRIGLFFAKLAAVSFGGAYSVLSYMAQEAVQTQHWLKPGEMVDGLGLAETTPGPLILVTEFVGFLAAFRAPAPFAPVVAGLLGAAMTLWTTFCPCFLWIFAGAPWIERLERMRVLQGALAAITAAVVGVIANLTLWFGLHVLFRRFFEGRVSGLSFSLPDPASLDLRALGLAVAAGVLLLVFKAGVMRTLAAAVVLGLGLHALGWA